MKVIGYGKYLPEEDFWVTISGPNIKHRDDYIPVYAQDSKPLSKEEIRNLWESTKGELGYLQFARLIEKAHGVNNEK
jgi:hypothetical protein